MKVHVDEDRCCGAGQCVLIAPQVFDQRDDDGIAVVLGGRPPEAAHAAVREAASVCPGAAIELEEAQ